DCDIGGDIDDEYALGLLLASPEFEVIGTITDSGDTEKRAQVACRMLYETGREDIPVIIGRKTGGTHQPQYNWATGFDKLKPQAGNAAEFIINNLRKYPNEIILFTVGPVTNIADVLEKDPDVLKLAKRVVSMFGSFYMGYGVGSKPEVEWNVKVDIPASKMLVASGADITYAGLDITTFVKFKQSDLQRLLMRQSPLTNALSGLYQLWQFVDYAAPNPTLFDVVAVGMVLWPDLFETESVHVSVNDEGFTIVDKNKKPNCRIGTRIQREEFIDRVMERLLKQNLIRTDDK
ncbi:MAG: nucleoside hydrolase, partial [Calditrichaeota bacterium]